MSRYGLNISDAQNIVQIAIGGKEAGVIYDGDKRFSMIVRLPESLRTNIEALKRIPIPLSKNREKIAVRIASNSLNSPDSIPLSAIAKFDLKPGPNQISRQNGRRLIIVTTNVRGRDIGSFMTEAQNEIQNRISLPPGYFIEYGGQFENMISATQRLQIVVPAALLLIFIFLFIVFRNIKDALLVYSGVPLAVTGGIFALWLRGIPLSITAGVGFIALSGVAVLNGVVLISFINRLRNEGMNLDNALFQGSTLRLRPVLMTALVAALGFVPMAIAEGRGAEVQRPLATVVIGGIITSTVLTLLVLPVLYRMFHAGEIRDKSEKSG
jgi:heavy metal efflux system protein